MSHIIAVYVTGVVVTFFLKKADCYRLGVRMPVFWPAVTWPLDFMIAVGEVFSTWAAMMNAYSGRRRG